MRLLIPTVMALCCAAAPLAAQQNHVQGAARQEAQADSGNPVSAALRTELARAERNLVGAAEAMPADKYGYKPTDAQMSFGQMVLHVAGANDYMCGTIAGVHAPERSKLQPTESKDSLVARMKDSFAFCGTALAHVHDAHLGEMVPFFGGRQVSRAAAVLDLTGDWYDHYSAAANYLRLNGILPPTARRAPVTK